MRRIFRMLVFVLTMAALIAGCTEKTESKNSNEIEIESFVNAYNEAVQTLEGNTDIKFDELDPDEFKSFEKTKDGYGYKIVLDERKDAETTSIYELTCLYDNKKNIIGFNSFGVGNPKNYNDDGTITFPNKGIGSGYVIAKALFNDTEKFHKHYLELMDQKGPGAISYEENNYKISMEADAKLGFISFKFMKTK